MTPERWKRVEQVFESALEHPPAERAAFLDTACEGDAPLRQQVESLLLALDQAGTSAVFPPLNTPATNTLASPASVIASA